MLRKKLGHLATYSCMKDLKQIETKVTTRIAWQLQAFKQGSFFESNCARAHGAKIEQKAVQTRKLSDGVQYQTTRTVKHICQF